MLSSLGGRVGGFFGIVVQSSAIIAVHAIIVIGTWPRRRLHQLVRQRRYRVLCRLRTAFHPTRSIREEPFLVVRSTVCMPLICIAVCGVPRPLLTSGIIRHGVFGLVLAAAAQRRAAAWGFSSSSSLGGLRFGVGALFPPQRQTSRRGI